MKNHTIEITDQLEILLRMKYTDYCNNSLENGAYSNLLPTFEDFLSIVLFWYLDVRK